MPPKIDTCPICAQPKQARSKTCFPCRFPKKKTTKCRVCGKETYNSKFCSRSCSVSHSNKVSPKRKSISKCIICEKPTSNRRKYCSDNCNPNIFVAECTLEEAELTRGPGRYSSIRYNARKIYKNSGLPMRCFVCGYNIHVEICHLKPISKFSKNSFISEINSLTNLVPLCPNHHWELDHKNLVVSVPDRP